MHLTTLNTLHSLKVQISVYFMYILEKRSRVLENSNCVIFLWLENVIYNNLTDLIKIISSLSSIPDYHIETHEKHKL